MDVFDDLAAQLGIDPDSPEERLGRALALADDDFLETLVSLRRQKRLTQQEVADRMKRDKSAVSRFENLGSDPKLSTIRRYARAIGVMVDHLVTDQEMDAEAIVERRELRTRYFEPPTVRSVQPDAAASSTHGATYRALGMVRG
ncbi:helix-turn-helix domain-containing protein [Dietzia sp. MNB45]|uniref:helix-turn-helix domain-containing protein n=1 Tax=Dietzia sp. MNB45 TaxID=3238800 RepID=UPI003F7CD49E